MRTLFGGLAALALGLATCLSAEAQAERQTQNRNQNRNQNNESGQGEQRAIRGVIAGVTVEGETAIDFRTQRAAYAERSYLTIVGSERSQDRNRDRDGDNAARNRDRDGDNAARNRDQNNRNERNDRDANDRQQAASDNNQRQNIYVVWLTPQTEIRRAGDRRNDRDRGDRNNNQENQNSDANRGRAAGALTLDALEVGDRVEVRFLQRNVAGDNQYAVNRKHGRHRTYFGDAVSVTILAEPGQNNREGDADRQQNRDRDRDRDQNNRDDDDTDK